MKQTLGFGYAPLDGKRRFLVVSVARSKKFIEMMKESNVTDSLCSLAVFYNADDGKSYCRATVVPDVLPNEEMVFAFVEEMLPDREITDRMFSLGIPKMKNQVLDLAQIECEFLMRLGMKIVQSGQDFETIDVEISPIEKKLESYFSAQAEQLTKVGSDLAKIMANTGADVIKRLSAQATPNAQTTQDVRAELYGVETRTIRRWDKGQGRPQGYDPNASLETMRVNGERYRHAEKANKAARELRKRKR